MKRRFRPWVVLAGLASALGGCDYSSSLPPPTFDYGPMPAADPAAPAPSDPGSPASAAAASNAEMKPAILESVISLIQSAALKPGGPNFEQAVSKLNHYFVGESPSRFTLRPEVRDYLAKELPPQALAALERMSFEMPDTRHLEDCMMYHAIATRVAGTGDDLTRVGRVFDWMVRQVQLAPAGSLASPQVGQAQVRPYDMLLRGLATEADGGWSERGWLFMALCRQLGIDVGLLHYTAPGAGQPTSWCCAALIDGKLYLFDPRLGLPIPGPDGRGVATLDEALSDPRVLGRLDLPGQAPYRPDFATLAGGKVNVWIDSSSGYLAPRMLLLQESLAGKYRMVLYRDPVEQRDGFAEALGGRNGGVTLWVLPRLVETKLFTDPNFVRATEHALLLFRPEFPLLYARVKQLRGDLPEAVHDYMSFRLPEVPLAVDRKTRIPDEIQQALDIYATHYLALAHLEQGRPDKAADFFHLALKMLPAPGPRQPYYHMFRWGAQTNLGLLNEVRGDRASAIAYYAEADPTLQHQGNLVRARELVWSDPLAPLPPPLPPPPPSPTPPPPPGAPAEAPKP